MSTFDYINGITIGSIAAELATADTDHFISPLIATIVYALAVAFVSFLSTKSIHMRRYLVGKPLILLNDGEICEKNLRKSKIDLNEFLTQCRVNGYFDLSEIQSVILEPDGRFSILPKAEYRHVIPSDLKLSLPQNYLSAVVIIDGKLMEENIKTMKKTPNWIEKQLKSKFKTDVPNVLLAFLSTDNQLTIYMKNVDIPTHTILL